MKREQKRKLNTFVSWLLFTVVVSFLPLLAMFFVDRNWGMVDVGNKYVGEILFACVMVSADALRILTKKRDIEIEWVKDLLLFISVSTIVLPAVLYGGMLIQDSKTNLLTLAIILFSFSFFSGLATQLYCREVSEDA